MNCHTGVRTILDYSDTTSVGVSLVQFVDLEVSQSV